MVKVISFDSPAFRKTLLKCLSSLTGLETVEMGSPM